ncbi:MAG: hypothetical protein Q4G37_06390, partial [Bifidobacterium sp.]|nr:hypothetical protein [Bifidobacterium sp.]
MVYESLYLTDYRINTFGQTLPGDQFDEVLAKVKEADAVVIGFSPEGVCVPEVSGPEDFSSLVTGDSEAPETADSD